MAKRRKRTLHPPIESSSGRKKKKRAKKKSKRKGPRVPVRRPVKVRADNGRVSGETRDIGWGGMFVKTNDVLEVGAEVDLKVQLEADAEAVIVRGLVVRANPEGPDSGMAIAFQTEGVDPDRDEIASFVREQDLEIKTERLEAAKQEFLEKVRTFEEEKGLFEREARTEGDQPTDDLTLKDEVRRAKREYLVKLQDTEARGRELEAELEREHQKVKRERDSFNRERNELDDERERIDSDREQDQQNLARERRMTHSHQASRQRDLEEHVARMQQKISVLANANDTLKARCQHLEQQLPAKRAAADEVAAFEARIAAMESEQTRVAADHEARRAQLESQTEKLTDELQTREHDVELARRDAKFRVWRLERQTRRIREDHAALEEELDQVDAARAQAIVELELADERRAGLEADVARLELELDEAKTRLSFREAMHEELQARYDAARNDMEMAQERCRVLEATIADGGQPPLPQAPALPVSEFFGQLPPVNAGDDDEQP